MKKKKILHVDANNFFVGCEILMNPELKGKPVCILSNNDGCVISRSYEAKALGVPMGIPHFMAKNKFNGVIYLSSNFTLYHDISSRMMNMLLRYSDKVDVYSIDEAFLDVTDIDNIQGIPFSELAAKIKSDIENELGLCVSVGVGDSKTLAKLATFKAKHSCGVYVIETDYIQSELRNINVSEIWGVGKQIERKLKAHGIFNAYQIIKEEDSFFKHEFGKKGLELKYELMGISVIPLTGIQEKPKSIQRTSAFSEFSKDKEYIKTEIMLHLKSVCKKLREDHLKTKIIAIILRTKDFRIFYSDNKLDSPTNSELELTKFVTGLFDSLFNEDITYRASGVLAFALEESDSGQMKLFKNNKVIKNDKLSDVIDNIENKYGKGSISVGSTGIKDVQELHKRKMRYRTFQ